MKALWRGIKQITEEQEELELSHSVFVFQAYVSNVPSAIVRNGR